MVRVLASSPMWPRFKSLRRRHMWAEFVVGSLLCLCFGITNNSQFKFDQGMLDEESPCGYATSIDSLNRY